MQSVEITGDATSVGLSEKLWKLTEALIKKADSQSPSAVSAGSQAEVDQLLTGRGEGSQAEKKDQ